MKPYKVPAATVDPLESVRNAFLILAEGAGPVAASLIEIAVNGKSEMARMYAATAVLDRVGLPAKVNVGVTATHLVGVVNGPDVNSAVEMVQARLQLLRTQAEASNMIEGGVVIPFPVPDDNDEGQ
ncbi:MAG: hypothetical protein ACOYD1_07855 [Candidatus Nanopelagicales bacterium]